MKTIIKVAADGSVLGICRTLNASGQYTEKVACLIATLGERKGLELLGSSFVSEGSKLHIVDYADIPGEGLIGYDKTFLGEIDYSTGKAVEVHGLTYDGTIVRLAKSKCRTLLHIIRRRARAAAYAPHDAKVARAVPGEVDKAEAQRARIRTLDADMQLAIEQANTEEALYTVAHGLRSMV